jgi:cell division protein FtsZ
MRRLQEAVQRAPHRAPAPLHAPAATRVVQNDAGAERPGFGLKSMIGRMTGHGAGQGEPAPQPRVQPPVQAAAPARPVDETPSDPEQDRIEIPAFLRRQAN